MSFKQLVFTEICQFFTSYNEKSKNYICTEKTALKIVQTKGYLPNIMLQQSEELWFSVGNKIALCHSFFMCCFLSIFSFRFCSFSQDISERIQPTRFIFLFFSCQHCGCTQVVFTTGMTHLKYTPIYTSQKLVPKPVKQANSGFLQLQVLHCLHLYPGISSVVLTPLILLFGFAIWVNDRRACKNYLYIHQWNGERPGSPGSPSTGELISSL